MDKLIVWLGANPEHEYLLRTLDGQIKITLRYTHPNGRSYTVHRMVSPIVSKATLDLHIGDVVEIWSHSYPETLTTEGS